MPYRALVRVGKSCYYGKMSTPIKVQLKREHHAPNGNSARVFLLLSRSGTQGQIQQVVDEKKVGDVLEVNLKDLRRVEPNDEQSALVSAVQSGYNRIVDKMFTENPLLDPNGNNEIDLLSWLGSNSNVSANRVIKTLLKHGADINHQTFENGHGPYWTPLWNAVHDDRLEHVKRLLAHGATFELPISHPSKVADTLYCIWLPHAVFGRPLPGFLIIHNAPRCPTMNCYMSLLAARM